LRQGGNDGNGATAQRGKLVGTLHVHGRLFSEDGLGLAGRESTGERGLLMILVIVLIPRVGRYPSRSRGGRAQHAPPLHTTVTAWRQGEFEFQRSRLLGGRLAQLFTVHAGLVRLEIYIGPKDTGELFFRAHSVLA